VLCCAAFLAVAIARGAVSTVPPNINASKLAGNEDESTIGIDPVNTSKIAIVSNNDSASTIFRAYSTNGGTTWTTGSIAGACCDGQMTFDSFGNLFLVYLTAGPSYVVTLVVSTDGGATFGAPTALSSTGADQPSVAAGAGSVWVDWNNGTGMVARGASVTGLGVMGAFGATQSIPSATGSFGDIAVGPTGKVTVTYQDNLGGQGPENIYVNTDADGLGAGGFGARVTATSTNVGSFDFIPAQSGRSIDAEANLAYDRTGGAHNGRLYLVYTDETPNESDDTNILVRRSDDNGATWSAAVKVNDDATTRSQFLPHISLDQTTGKIAVTWEDSRNDGGVVGSGSTDAAANNDAMYYGAVSGNGGLTFGPNFQISAGTSNAVDAAAPVDYGDYAWSDYYGGHLHPVWSDNSNSTGDNPNGTLHQFDQYTADVTGSPTAVAILAFTARRTAAGVVVRWSVPVGGWAAGFNVYRERSGSWSKVNRRLIPARSAQLANDYRFVDSRPGHATRYRLQVVGIDGTRAWRGVVAAAD
jgi:hypothetical protein